MVRDERTSAATADLPPDYVMLPLTKVRVGAHLRRPVYDGCPGSKQLLLAAGKQVTPAGLIALKNRGIVSLLIHRSDFEQLSETDLPQRKHHRHSSASRLAVTPLPISTGANTKKLASWAGWKVDSDSYLHQLQPPAQGPRSTTRVAAFQASYDKAVESTTIVFERLTTERRLLTDTVLQTTERQLQEVQTDLDEFLMRGAAPILKDYPSRHSLQTAMLATSMATLMGHPQDDLIELGFGCLLHDVGMLQIPSRLLSAPSALAAADRLELQKHPIISANLIQDCREVPQASRHIVYQMHERMNGTGYPRGRAGAQIHPLARIAAVADAYLALISPRPHRSPLSPYQAVERLLLSARQGQFDPSVIRALLNAVSLFPVGSKVRLNDGRIAVVIRGNRDQFARPVIQLIDPVSPLPGAVIDLAGHAALQVASALESVETSNSKPQTPPSVLQAAAAAL